jgi:hypothetical protein
MAVPDNGPIAAGRKLLRIRLGTQRITRKEIGEVKSILSNVKQNVEEILERIPAGYQLKSSLRASSKQPVTQVANQQAETMIYQWQSHQLWKI